MRDGNCVVRLIPDIPVAGNRQWSFLLPQGYAGEVHLSAQVEIRPGVFRPIAWASEQEQNADGSIAVEVKAHDDPSWRKGV